MRNLIGSRAEVDAYRPQTHFLVGFDGGAGGQERVFDVYAKEGDPTLLAHRLTGGRLTRLFGRAGTVEPYKDPFCAGGVHPDTLRLRFDLFAFG